MIVFSLAGHRRRLGADVFQRKKEIRQDPPGRVHAGLHDPRQDRRP